MTTINDIQICYESNPYFIEVDCLPWNIVERKTIPELLKNITRQHTVASCMRHIIVLRNIDSLNEHHLHALRNIIEDAGMNALFFCTCRRRSYVQCRLGGLLFVRLLFNVKDFVTDFVLENHPILICQVETIIDSSNNDPIIAACMVHKDEMSRNGGSLKPQVECVYNYISKRIIEMICAKKDHDRYKIVADTVNTLISSDIPCMDTLTCCLKVATHSVYNTSDTILRDVMALLSSCDLMIKTSNKPHFVLESMFFKLSSYLSTH
jgi:hypothetical protein